MKRVGFSTALVLVAVSLLAGCGSQSSQTSTTSPPQAEFEQVPPYLAQALAVAAATLDREITPQSAMGLYVVSTLVRDPLGRPAFWANLLTSKPGDFRTAIMSAPDNESVYLTGAATNRTFHGDTLSAKAIKNVLEACPKCRLVYYAHTLFGVDGNTWYGPDGKPLPAEAVDQIKKVFEAIAVSVEKGDIPTEMAKRWARLERESGGPPLSPQGLADPENPPPLHVGTQFFRAQGGIAPQYEDPGSCLSWFLWWCTAYRRTGYVGQFADYDFGNWQYINWSLGWRENPRQNYNNPRNAPNESDPNNLWGAWDFGTAGLKVGSEFNGGQYLVGCGPLSVARLLDWMRHAGELGSSVTLRLPRDDFSYSGVSVTIGRNEDARPFLQMVFWPVKVGVRTDLGNKNVYSGWLSWRMGAHHFMGETMTLPSKILSGANAWLADNQWPQRLDGTWLRDLDLWSVIGGLIPNPINWVVYTQNTWRVNGILRNSIGAKNRPAIALYQSSTIPLLINGIRIGGLHYAMVKKYEVVEYWDWSANWVELSSNGYDAPYWTGSTKVFLSDYYDLSFGAYQVQ